MRFKSTLVVFVITILVGSYAYFVEFKGGKKKEEKKRAEERVLGLERDQVTKISVTFKEPTPKKMNCTLEKKGGYWEFTEPKSYRVDAGKITSLLSSLTTQSREEEDTPEAKEKPDVFGLKPAEITVRVFDQGGKETVIELGMDVPSKWSNYFMSSTLPSAYVVSRSFKQAFDREITELRDKSLLSIDKQKVHKMEVSVSGGRKWSAIKNVDQWVIDAPVSLATDQTAWSDWYSAFFSQKADSFSHDGRPDSAALSRYGLSNPGLKLVFWDEAKQKLGELWMSKVKSKEAQDKNQFDVFAYAQGGDYIGKLSQGVWDRLAKDFSDLAVKRPIAFSKGDVTEISVTRSKQGWVLKKSETGWRVHQGEVISEADSAVVDDLLSAAMNFDVKAEGWAKGAGRTSLSAELGRIEYKGKKGDQALAILASLVFGQPSSGRTLVQVSDLKALASIEAKRADVFLKKAENIKVKKVEEQQASTSVDKTAAKGTWKMLEPTFKDKKDITKLDKPTVEKGKKYFATFETAKGNFQIEFFSNEAPYTVSNFLHLARNKFYNGLTFHRVIQGFMAQGGDPSGTGSGGPGWKFQDEFSSKKHERGSLSMANVGPNTNGSRFFICYAAHPHLDGKHSVFGKVMGDGMAVVDKITNGDVMKSVKVFEETGNQVL